MRERTFEGRVEIKHGELIEVVGFSDGHVMLVWKDVDGESVEMFLTPSQTQKFIWAVRKASE